MRVPVCCAVSPHYLQRPSHSIPALASTGASADVPRVQRHRQKVRRSLRPMHWQSRRVCAHSRAGTADTVRRNDWPFSLRPSRQPRGRPPEPPCARRNDWLAKPSKRPVARHGDVNAELRLWSFAYSRLLPCQRLRLPRVCPSDSTNGADDLREMRRGRSFRDRDVLQGRVSHGADASVALGVHARRAGLLSAGGRTLEGREHGDAGFGA